MSFECIQRAFQTGAQSLNIQHASRLCLALSILIASEGIVPFSTTAQSTTAAPPNQTNEKRPLKPNRRHLDAYPTRIMLDIDPHMPDDDVPFKHSDGDEHEATESRLPITLNFRQTEGVSLSVAPTENTDTRGSFWLATLNGQDLRDKSITELRKIYFGKEGDQATLGAIDSEGHFKTFTLKYRQLPQLKPTDNSVKSLRGLFQNLNHRYEPTWDPSTNRADYYYESRGMDLFTSALHRQQLAVARDFPATSTALVDFVLVPGARGFLSQGNLSQAQAELKDLKAPYEVPVGSARALLKEYSRLLNLLDLYDRQKEAIKIAAGVISTVQSENKLTAPNIGFQDELERQQLYGSYLNNLAEAGSGIDPTILKLPDGPPGFTSASEKLWRGDYFERFNQYDKAITCYENVLTSTEKSTSPAIPKSDNPDRELSQARHHCYLLFRLAQFYSKQNLDAKAKEYLLRAHQVYTTFFTEEQLAKFECLPLFSPSPSAVDLALAQACAKTSDSASAIKYAKLALTRLPPNTVLASDKLKDEEIVAGLESKRWNNLFTEIKRTPIQGEPDESETSFMRIFNRVQAATASGDTKNFMSDVNTLLNLCKERRAQFEYSEHQVDMYSCMLNLARHEANRGRFALSDTLLNALRKVEDNSTHDSITVEFIDIEKALNAELSGHPDATRWRHVFDQWQSEYTNYEKLRALGSLYLDAGEFERAEILIKNALKLCKNTRPDSRIAYSIALLYLDDAFLNANHSKFEESHVSFVKALNCVDLLPTSAPSHELDLFNRMFMCRAVQLARLNRLNNNTDAAANILKDVISRIENKKCWLGVFELTDQPSIDPALRYVYGYYGRLLFDNRKYLQARQYLDKAMKDCGNSQPAFLSIVRANCAAQQQDYATAALDLSALISSSVLDDSVFGVDPARKKTFIRMTFNYALKAKNLPPNKLASIYLQFVNSLDASTANNEKLELLRKAYLLGADNSPERQRIAQSINFLIAAMGSKSDNVQIESLEMREALAVSAEKNKKPDTRKLWCLLADEEFRQKQFAKGIKDVTRALDLKEPKFSNNVSEWRIFDYAVSSLVTADRASDAESLLIKILDKSKIEFGATSRQYSNALKSLINFYAKQNNEDLALEYLDKLLAIDPRRQEFGKYFTDGMDAPFNTLKILFHQNKNNSLTVKMLEKILNSQTVIYDSDDAHLADTMTQIGVIETERGNYERAEKLLKQALAINALYGSDWMGTLGIGPDNGPASWSAMQTLLKKEHKVDDLQPTPETRKAKRKEGEEHRGIARNASEQKVKELYEWWHERAPYSMNCIEDGVRLLELVVKRNDWESVHSVAPEVIKALAHNSLFAVGGCTPSPQPAQRKFYCFKMMIEACIKTNRSGEANKWLQRAVAEESYEPQTEELVFLAEIANACGNKLMALTYCRRAEKLAKADSWFYWSEVIEQIFEKLDAEEDLNKIANEVKLELLENNQKQQRKFDADRKAQLQQQARFKQPPTLPTGSKQTNFNFQRKSIYQRPESLRFSPVKEISGKYLFNYAAFAIEHLWLLDGAKVVASPQSSDLLHYSFAGSHIGMSTCQPPHYAGAFIFLYDGPPQSLILKPTLSESNANKSPNTAALFDGPPPIMALPLKHSIEAPQNATVLSSSEGNISLKAQNYTAENFSSTGLEMPAQGIVRIFVKDADGDGPPLYVKESKSYVMDPGPSESTKPVFQIKKNGQISWPSNLSPSTARSNLEIWYEGEGEIWLDDDVRFAGIIYAPNAIIRLGTRTSFLGAMVACNIVAKGEARIMYDPALQNWKE
jgi:hypothetical protein